MQSNSVKYSHALKVYQTVMEENKTLFTYILLGDGPLVAFCDCANCHMDKKVLTLVK